MTYYKEIYIAFNADMSKAHMSQAFLNSALSAKQSGGTIRGLSDDMFL